MVPDISYENVVDAAFAIGLVVIVIGIIHSYVVMYKNRR